MSSSQAVPQPSWKVAAIREAWRAEQEAARLAQGAAPGAIEAKKLRDREATKGQKSLIAAIDHALDTTNEPSPHVLAPLVLERLSFGDRDAAFREALRVCIEARIYERQGEPQPVRIESDKVRENRLRRAAQRQGLQIAKSRRRDFRALDYGGYMIVDPNTNSVVAGATPNAYMMDLDQVEDFLRGES